MKLIYEADNRFKIVDFPWWIGAVFFPLAFFFAWQIFQHWNLNAPLLGYLPLLLGALVSGLGAAFLTQRSEFDFDVNNKQVKWQRQSLFGRKAGTIPFYQIEYAVVQCSSGARNSGTSYRVVLSTAQGIIPLTNAYSAGQDAHCQEIRSLINRALGVELASESDNDIREMERQGDTFGAARLAKARGTQRSSKSQNDVRIGL